VSAAFVKRVNPRRARWSRLLLLAGSMRICITFAAIRACAGEVLRLSCK